MIISDNGEVRIASQHPLRTKEARTQFTAELVTIYKSFADTYGLVETIYIMQLAAMIFADDKGIKIGE